jgi:Domain of unknown function (DUF1906)
MTLLIDYSFKKPSTTELQIAGVTSVGRYFGPATLGKCITNTEAYDLLGAGISYWGNFEHFANDAKSGSGGSAQGQINAQTALAHAPADFPSSRPIYFSVDSEVSGATLTQAVAYIQGVASVLGAARTGVYGEGALLIRCRQLGIADWFWLSGATSYPTYTRALPFCHIVQKVGGQPLPTTDLDVQQFADWGQVPAPSSAPTQTKRSLNMAAEMGTGTIVVRPTGSVYCFGGAQYHGSLGQINPALPPGGSNSVVPAQPIVGVAVTPTGGGYWIVGMDGGIYCFGSGATYLGSLPQHPTWHAGTAVGIATWLGNGKPTNGNGYTIVCDNGGSQPATYNFTGNGAYATVALGDEYKGAVWAKLANVGG